MTNDFLKKSKIKGTSSSRTARLAVAEWAIGVPA